MQTLQAFTKAAPDDQTKAAVLLETTRSIYAIAPYGYLDGTDAPAGGDQIKVFELIKSVGKTG